MNLETLVAAQKAALRVGANLARLEKEGVITLTSKPWPECVPHLIKVPAKVGAKAREALGKRIADGESMAVLRHPDVVTAYLGAE